jgi:hypothetical protein
MNVTSALALPTLDEPFFRRSVPAAAAAACKRRRTRRHRLHITVCHDCEIVCAVFAVAYAMIVRFACARQRAAQNGVTLSTVFTSKIVCIS